MLKLLDKQPNKKSLNAILVIFFVIQRTVSSEISQGVLHWTHQKWDSKDNLVEYWEDFKQERQVIQTTHNPQSRGSELLQGSDNNGGARQQENIIVSPSIKNNQQLQSEGQLPQSLDQLLGGPTRLLQNSELSSQAEVEGNIKFNLQGKRQLQIASATQSSVTVNKEFSNIELYHQVPNVFKKGETYFFKGRMIKETAPQASPANQALSNTVYVSLRAINTRDQISCSQVVEAKTNYTFEIGCTMSQTGRYQLTIYAGQYGTTSRNVKSVVNEDKNMNFTPFKAMPKGLRLEIRENNLYVHWDSQEDITRLAFTQPKNILGDKKEYLITNKARMFKVPFIDFKFYREEETIFEISHADSEDGTLYTRITEFSDSVSSTFLATEHKFSDMFQDLAKIDPPIPWRMEVGEKFTIKGTFSSNIRSIIYLVAPDLRITTINLIKNPRYPQIADIIPAGTPISVEISFDIPGAHVLEINADSGQALVNRPIYVGLSYPLTPDFEDLRNDAFRNFDAALSSLEDYVAATTTNERVAEPTQNSDIKTKREYLLRLTNSLREKYEVSPVYLDDMLNTLSQNHAEDMRDNNYFSHTNLKGQGPGGRAMELGFLGAVGENIAFSYTLTEAHLQLERSAAHLSNTVKENWMRVGVGIAMKEGGGVYVVFVFSDRDVVNQPLTSDEMLSEQAQFAALVKQFNPLITEDKNLSAAISKWANSGQTTSLFNYLRSAGFNGSLSSSSFQVSYQRDWVNSLRANRSYLTQSSSSLRSFGVGFNLTPQNIVQAFLVFKN